MIISIFVNELETIKHITNKYAVVFIYFFEINSFKKWIEAVIIKKIYLIKSFKANLLIKNDVLSSEKIDILTQQIQHTLKIVMLLLR